MWSARARLGACGVYNAHQNYLFLFFVFLVDPTQKLYVFVRAHQFSLSFRFFSSPQVLNIDLTKNSKKLLMVLALTHLCCVVKVMKNLLAGKKCRILNGFSLLLDDAITSENWGNFRTWILISCLRSNMRENARLTGKTFDKNLEVMHFK